MSEATTLFGAEDLHGKTQYDSDEDDMLDRERFLGMDGEMIERVLGRERCTSCKKKVPAAEIRERVFVSLQGSKTGKCCDECYRRARQRSAIEFSLVCFMFGFPGAVTWILGRLEGSPIGMIVCGVICGIFYLVLLCYQIYCWSCRPKEKDFESDSSSCWCL